MENSNMRISFGQTVYFGFGLGLLILIGISIASYRCINDFYASSELRKHTYEVITNIEHVSSLLNDMRADARGYVITGQDSILYRYPSEVKMILQKIKTIKELTSKEPDHQKLVETLEPIIARLIEFNRQIIEIREKQGHEAAVDLVMTGRGDQLMKDIEKLISELIEEESKLLKQRDESLRVVARTTKNIIVAGSLLAIAIVILSLVVIWHELTRRKQAEEALQKAHDELEIKVRERTAELAKSNEALLKVNRAYKALSECNQALVRATDESSLLHDICRIIVEAGGYLMALVGYAEPDEQKTVRPVAQMGYEENFLGTVNLTWADTERGHGPLGTAIRTHTPSVFRNIAAESASPSGREAALKRGYASAIGLPLIASSDLLGALVIYSAEPYAFDEEEMKLLTELADDLAYGIMTLRTRVENKQAEEEIRKINTELEQRVTERTSQFEAANKELEAFSSSVAHDLRAPLRHIMGFIELLKDRATQSFDEQSLHYMNVISDSANKMGTLIEDLLSFSRMGCAEMIKTKVKLNQLVKETLNTLDAETKGRDIIWKVDQLPEVYGDPAMLRLVLVNLISNALKFTRTRPQARIEIGCTENEKEALFYVRDNGVGFDMAYADKLFGLFQRLHSAQDFKGAGVGLANVRRIVQRHGGRTWAEGNVDKGATFYFSLQKIDNTDIVT